MRPRLPADPSVTWPAMPAWTRRPSTRRSTTAGWRSRTEAFRRPGPRVPTICPDSTKEGFTLRRAICDSSTLCAATVAVPASQAITDGELGPRRPSVRRADGGPESRRRASSGAAAGRLSAEAIRDRRPLHGAAGRAYRDLVRRLRSIPSVTQPTCSVPNTGDVGGTPFPHPDYNPNAFFLRDVGVVGYAPRVVHGLRRIPRAELARFAGEEAGPAGQDVHSSRLRAPRRASPTAAACQESLRSERGWWRTRHLIPDQHRARR